MASSQSVNQGAGEWIKVLKAHREVVRQTLASLEELQEYEELLLGNQIAKNERRLIRRLHNVMGVAAEVLLSLGRPTCEERDEEQQKQHQPRRELEVEEDEKDDDEKEDDADDDEEEALGLGLATVLDGFEILFSFCLRHDESSSLDLLADSGADEWCARLFALAFSRRRSAGDASRRGRLPRGRRRFFAAQGPCGALATAWQKSLELMALVLWTRDRRGEQPRKRGVGERVAKGLVVATVEQATMRGEEEDELYSASVHALLWVAWEAQEAVVEALFLEPAGAQLGLFLVKLLNRATGEFTTLPLLRLLDRLFADAATAGLLYANDVPVLVDVLLRQLANCRRDAPETAWRLSLLSGVLHHSAEYAVAPHRPLDVRQLLDLLLEPADACDALDPDCKELCRGMLAQLERLLLLIV